ncbi:hypothetical protein D3C87_145980 [compost metagenome]
MSVIQDSDNTKAIKMCLSCSKICLETLHHCLNNGKNGLVGGMHLALLQQCADACQLSGRLMIAESRFHHQACELSFEICQACAEECERFENDPLLARCADVCRKCAESCRAMAGMTVRIPQEEIARASMT